VLALAKILGGLSHWLYYLLYDPMQALAFSILILYAARGFRGVFGKMLQWKPIVYVGRISYGIYVYHPFMLTLAIYLLQRIGGVGSATQPWIASSLATVLTLVVASLSWKLMEKPLNDLKRRF
jgi:peptidoglycan/LPS O-acetylase OafA/YrhL